MFSLSTLSILSSLFFDAGSMFAVSEGVVQEIASETFWRNSSDVWQMADISLQTFTICSRTTCPA